MYKGNMQEFTDKVINYVKEKYGEKFSLEQSFEWELEQFKRRTTDEKPEWVKTSRKFLTLWHHSGKRGAYGVGQTLYDRADFEEQVYKFINERLKK